MKALPNIQSAGKLDGQFLQINRRFFPDAFLILKQLFLF
jgi:hypothetical protein